MVGLIIASFYAFAILFSCLAAEPKTLGLKFDVGRHQLEPLTNEKRTIPVGGLLSNQKTGYWANISIGTPPQWVSVQLDTGSSDLWIPSLDSETCRHFKDDCLRYGSYDPSQSSSIKDLQQGFEIFYVDGRGVEGTFINETLGIFGMSLDDVQMGLDSSETVESGILGIGFDSGEAGIHLNNMTAYPNLVSQLFLGGYINSRSYSIWLDDHNAASGSLLFSGIDASKYSGDLLVLPIVDPPAPIVDIPRTAVQLTALTFDDAEGSHDLVPEGLNIRVTLDTGASFCVLPKSVAGAMYAAAGVVADAAPLVGPAASCNLTAAPESFTFGFGGPDGAKIRVPIGELIIPTWNTGWRPLGATSACFFGIAFTDDPRTVILGDTFLRSAYVVYDLDNKQIGIAQADNATGIATPPQIQEITNGTAGMPGASKTATMIPWPTSYVREWYSFASSLSAHKASTAIEATATVVPAA